MRCPGLVHRSNFVRRSVGRVAVLTLGALAATARPAAAETPPPNIETGSPTLLGATGLSLNGRLHSHGAPASYYFEYGPTADYGQRTETRRAPPRLAAHYREAWDQGWNGWRSWDSQHLHFTEGGAAGGHIRYEAIAKDDHNHDDGIGTVHLAKYMYPGSFSPIPSAYLSAGDPDLRDAKIKVAVRGVDWRPNGTELQWWSQSQSNIELNADDFTLSPDYKHSNWTYTGFNLTDLLVSGDWEWAEYRLHNDTRHWSYCGNNGGESRYDAYWSIDRVQRHLNIDLFHMVVFVDTENRPTGAIDFDEFEITYGDYSLASPANGGKLIDAPSGSTDDPSLLTDGWRNGAGHTWRSGSAPSAPLEFTYAFARPVTIQAAQLHQHPEWPSREVEILVSDDGRAWQPLTRGEIPEQAPEGPNYVFLLERGLNAAAQQVKVRILSGYKSEHWGLGEIELFGVGAEYATDDDWRSVNEDIVDLEPGQTCHYRLVASSATGETLGAGQSFTLPSDDRPHVVTGGASRVGGGAAKVEGRLNPLGKRTEFYFEYGPTREYGQRTRPQYGGLQITPRLAFAWLSDLRPGAEYHYRLVAVNEVGASHGDDATFTAR